MQLVAGYTGATQIASPAVHAVPLTQGSADAAGAPVHSQGVTRAELAAASQRLQAILDDHWKRYLALPGQVYSGQGPPAVQALTDTLTRYDAIAKDPRYRVLVQRSEFQATHALLKKYQTSLTGAADTKLTLPPPPAQSSAKSGQGRRY
jgi:hypothetical protein